MTEVHILGAGAIGSLIASYFVEATLPVTLLIKNDRTPTQTIIEKNNRTTQFDFHCEQVGEKKTPLNTLLLTTKAYDSLTAINSVRNRITPKTHIIILQNGMGVFEKIQSHFPNNPISASTIDYGVTRQSSSHFIETAKGTIWLESNESANTLFNQFSKAGLNIKWDGNIQPRLWEKLIVNSSINPTTVKFNCTNGELLTNSAAKAWVDNICAEATQVMIANNLIPPTNPPIHKVYEVAKRTEANYSSMLQDIKRGLRTEIDYLNAYIVDQALRHNIPTPYNDAIIQHVRSETHG